MAQKSKRIKSTTNGAPTEFNPDYTYIKRDLGRIGMLASFFFVALIIASFFVK